MGQYFNILFTRLPLEYRWLLKDDSRLLHLALILIVLGFISISYYNFLCYGALGDGKKKKRVVKLTDL